MKRASLLLYVIGALFLVSFQTDKWSPYTSNDGHFKISFPTADPTISSQKVPVNDVDYTMNLAYVAATDGYTYMIAWTDMSAHFPDKTVKQFLEDSRDGSVNNIKGTNVVTEKLITTGSQPYIEFTYDSEKAKGKTRIYLINKVQYTILVLSESTSDFTNKANKFLHSFYYN